jgi:transposase
MRKIRLPEKRILRWLIENYGIGGMINYTREQNEAILISLAEILRNAGPIELDFLGKLLIQLSNYPRKAELLLEELENEGF